MTFPSLISPSTTFLASEEGMARPIPTKPLPPDWRYAVLMPTTLPARLTRRAPRVARIDRGVGLNKRLVFLGNSQIFSFGRQTMPAVTVVFEPQRGADRQDPVADIELVGVAPVGLNFQRCAEPEDRKVGLGVGSHHPRRNIVTLFASRTRIRSASLTTW